MMRIKILLISFIVFFVFISSLYAQEVSQQFQGFNLQGYAEGGEKSWDVNGDTADVLGNHIAITNVVAHSYGQQKVDLTARTGTIDKESGHIQLKEDVVITTERGTQLTTEVLNWDRNADLVSTDEFVTITDEGMVATGTGLRAQPELKIAQLNEDVTVKVNTKPKEPTGQIVTVTCDGPLEIDQAKYLAIFNENVVAVETGREIKADKMELYFDPQTNKIKEMICIGHVVITQGENVSYSDRAIYNSVDQKFILTGRPKLQLLTEGENSIGSFGKKEESE